MASEDETEKEAKEAKKVGVDPSPLFWGSVDSSGDEVACFHTDLKVLILMGVGAGGIGSRFWRKSVPLYSPDSEYKNFTPKIQDAA